MGVLPLHIFERPPCSSWDAVLLGQEGRALMPAGAMGSQPHGSGVVHHMGKGHFQVDKKGQLVPIPLRHAAGWEVAVGAWAAVDLAVGALLCVDVVVCNTVVMCFPFPLPCTPLLCCLRHSLGQRWCHTMCHPQFNVPRLRQEEGLCACKAL